MEAAGAVRADSKRIAVWRIERDPRQPERLVTRREDGAVGYESLDGGRSWRPADVA